MGETVSVMKGRAFGNYVVRQKLGEGGMGEVFLAEHRRMGRKAAVKVLRAQGCANQHEVERFFNEARAASIVDHPGIVQIFDCDFHDQGAYLIMEYLEGRSLAEALRHAKSFSATPETIRSIGGQIANVLAAVHAKGIVHRDLKPDNVFLEDKRSGGFPFLVRILDFGIAKLMAVGPSGLTKSGMVLGTPSYMAPEQCAGDREIDTRADIYSLGCMLFEMAAGAPPFVRAGLGSLITAQMSELAPSVDKAWADAPAGFVSLVAQMLAKDPAERPQTMLEVETRLNSALSLPTGGSASLVRAGDGPSSATTVSLRTQELPAPRPGAKPEGEPTLRAPTAASSSQPDLPQTPTAILPVAISRPAAEGSQRPTREPVPTRSWFGFAESNRTRLLLIGVAGVAVLVLVVGLHAARPKARPVVAPRSAEAGSRVAAPVPTITPPPTRAAEQTLPAPPSIPVEAEPAAASSEPTDATDDKVSAQRAGAAPDTTAAVRLGDRSSAVVKEASPRRRGAAAVEGGHERGGATAERQTRPSSQQRGSARPQPKREIRGFNDF